MYGGQNKENGWDDPLPAQELSAWADFMREVVYIVPIKLSRSTKPENSEGRLWLVAFHDGSLSAFCMVIYILWTLKHEIKEGQPPLQERQKATLMMAKSRVTPIHGTTLLPSEIQSLTMLTKGLALVAHIISDRPESINLWGDSECSIAALDKNWGSFGSKLCK